MTPSQWFKGNRTDAKHPELCKIFPTCEAKPHQLLGEVSVAKILLIHNRVNKLEGLKGARK